MMFLSSEQFEHQKGSSKRNPNIIYKKLKAYKTLIITSMLIEVVKKGKSKKIVNLSYYINHNTFV